MKYECVHFCRRRVNPMTASREDRKGQFRTIYEELNRDFRIYIKDLAKVLMIDRDTASRRLREALTEGIITSPQLRKRSYADFKEYAYLVKCENPLPLFKQYKEDEDVVYHAVMSGFADLWIISKKKIDIKGVIVGGLRSDYHVAYAPNHSWGKAIQTMWEMIENFNPETYKPKGIIETHWDETLEWWDAQFEALYGQFKFNGRRKFSPVMRECHVSSDKIYRFLENLPECCSVFTRYFPNSIAAYDPYLFMLETDYEDFLIELLSELPTSSFFFKATDKLFVLASVERSSMRNFDLDMSDISQLHIPLIIDNLISRGILKRGVHAIVEYSWSKDL
ncbi:MAG: Lrp/AsnC family transcriptional regulator [Theionarchaea archaeon]|nr:Lrp/AsnC family transcriptional regulator [Theionarchaea archaeon]